MVYILNKLALINVNVSKFNFICNTLNVYDIQQINNK